MMHQTQAFFTSPREQYRATLIGFGLVLAFLVLSFAFSAHAQVFGSVNSGFGCGAGGGGGGGSILQQGSCPSSIEDGKIFSYFVCNMEKLIGEVFGQFYCQLQSQFFGPMSAVVTLAITLFGVAFLIGVVQATARDAMIFLFKVCAVWGFATQADLLIGVAYNFFMGGLKEGIAIVVSGIFHPPSGMSVSGEGGQRVYEYMDEVFKKFVTFSTESAGSDSSGGGTGSGSGSGEDNPCKNAIFAALALLALAFPPLFALGIFLFIKFIIFFLRAVFGYIYAIIGISLLIVLAPIFLSFYFWQATRQFFDSWIGYLVSFAMQMVIIFAFIAFVLSMDFKSIAKELLDLVVPYKESVERPGMRWPWEVCTICEFTVTDSNSGSGGTPGGSVKCKDNPGKPIPPSELAGPGNSSAGGMNSTLLKLTAKVVLTLVVLAYVLTALLEIIPQLASRIASAGGAYAPPLVGPNMPLPGEKAFQTFEQQFMERLNQGGNPVTAYSEAFKEATSALMVGARGASGGNVGPGISQLLQDYLWTGGVWR